MEQVGLVYINTFKKIYITSPFSTVAYTTRDVLYKWNRARQVVIAPDLMLSQFDLIAAPSGTENTTRRGGKEPRQ